MIRMFNFKDIKYNGRRRNKGSYDKDFERKV